MASGFQTTIQAIPAIGIEGDFCDANPRFTVDAGAGGLVSGLLGLTMARFCWTDNSRLDPENAPTVVNSRGSGAVTGFVSIRGLDGLITTYLADATMVIPSGRAVTVFSGGGFWVKNNGTTAAQIGQKAYAYYADGSASFAATGTPTTGGSGTASTVAAGTNSFTGTIAGNVLTVASGGITGTIYPGTTISGSGVTSGSIITSQLTGTPGGAGNYALNFGEQTVASTTISGTYGLLTIGGTVAGAPFGVGQTISGSSVVAGTTITALGTGTGGAGTYIVNNNTVVSSTTITAASINVETKWIAMSAGAVGEIIKIQSHPNG